MNFALIVRIWYSLIVKLAQIGWTVPDYLVYCCIWLVIQNRVIFFLEFLSDDSPSHCYGYCSHRVQNLDQVDHMTNVSFKDFSTVLIQ